MHQSDDAEVSARSNVDNIFIGIFEAPTRPRLLARARQYDFNETASSLEPVSLVEPLAQLIATEFR